LRLGENTMQEPIAEHCLPEHAGVHSFDEGGTIASLQRRSGSVDLGELVALPNLLCDDSLAPPLSAPFIDQTARDVGPFEVRQSPRATV
jgi:hypothetical protein